MKYDYHMHVEYGDYDVEWVKGFFEAAAARGLKSASPSILIPFLSLSSFIMMI